VHEAWLKLGDPSPGGFEDRGHFLAVASKAMRSILVDHVRAKRAQKRGGQARRDALDETIALLEGGEVDLLDLEAALLELERDDPELARLVEMRFFGGLTHAEIAALQGCSLSTIERGWRLARARLARRLSPGGEA
jgi:RNA polymerase sigma factor (TIGR02999 family)